VAFVVTADGPGPDDPDTPDDPYNPDNPPPEGSLVIKDGKFKGLKEGDSTKAKIEFITAGYDGTAEVYYAVVDAGAAAPGYSEYTGTLGSVTATVIPTLPELPTPHGGEIVLPALGAEGYQADGNYDVYVILYKEGKVSAPVKINTGKGGVDVDWIWEEEAPEGMAAIQGGTFLMGTHNHGGNETQHSVTVSSFYMSKYEVSQAEYALYDAGHANNFTGANLPVEHISWHDAVGYCNWRSEEEGLTPAYTINGTTVTWNKGANGYRLPTEAEWEYACRAGTTTPFNTGDNITTDQANYYGAEYRKTTVAVDSFEPNGWGLYNMHGNVWEWCWDRYGSTYYSDSEASGPDPDGPDTNVSLRVLRGGCWNSGAAYLRSAYRNTNTSDHQNDNFGFRLVRGFIGG
jgi:formylglycine-generating enzyme required for sulfatase activity